MSASRGYEVDVERERLHWTVELGGVGHVIDLIPAVTLRTVAIEVDGRTIGHVEKATPQRPWRETALEIDGTPVVFAAIWNRPVMHTDVFVDGRSLRDRRTIEIARASAPEPETNYEVWIGGLFRRTVPGRRSFLPRWMAAMAAVSLVALVLLFVWMARPSGVVAAAVVVVAMVVLFLIWFRSWAIVIERVHLALLDRPDLDDRRRLAWFFAAFLAYPVLSTAVVVLLLGLARTATTR